MVEPLPEHDRYLLYLKLDEATRNEQNEYNKSINCTDLFLPILQELDDNVDISRGRSTRSKILKVQSRRKAVQKSYEECTDVRGYAPFETYTPDWNLLYSDKIKRKKSSTKRKRAIIVQHRVASSSDDDENDHDYFPGPPFLVEERPSVHSMSTRSRGIENVLGTIVTTIQPTDASVTAEDED